MTPQEKQAQQKKNADVIEAGRGAYRMVIPISGNPHSKQPFRDLWDKGWRLERRKDDAARNPGRPAFQPKPSVPKAQVPATGAAPAPMRKPFVRNAAPRPDRPVQQQVKPAAQTQAPAQTVITDRLIERFNNRNQTRS